MTEALFFNSHSGFLEALIRGYKVTSVPAGVSVSHSTDIDRFLQAGLLSQNQYQNLTQCETVDGQCAIDMLVRITTSS
jgi:V-type H+-transporting ATPase subunit d